MRLLLIENDLFIGRVVENSLRKKCYAVDWLRNGTEVDVALRIYQYDLIILDIDFPEKNGMDILRELRAHNHALPVLILSENNTKNARVLALDEGADDYLVKPFAQDELEARIRALLRRTYRYTNSIISFGTLTLNLNSQEVIVNEQLIKLSRREFAVLRIFLDQPGVVLSKRQIEEKLYDWSVEISSNVIDVHIYQLRKKLGGNIIHTLRGIGYKFHVPTSNVVESRFSCREKNAEQLS